MAHWVPLQRRQPPTVCRQRDDHLGHRRPGVESGPWWLHSALAVLELLVCPDWVARENRLRGLEKKLRCVHHEWHTCCELKNNYIFIQKKHLDAKSQDELLSTYTGNQVLNRKIDLVVTKQAIRRPAYLQVAQIQLQNNMRAKSCLV